MARNPMQDIVPKGTKSIRRVSVSETRPRATPRVEEVIEEKKGKKMAEFLKPVKVEQTEEIHKKDVEEIRITHDETNTIESVRHEFEASRAKSRPRRKGERNWKKIISIGGSVVVILLVIILSNLFHGATLTITPRSKTQNIESDYTAYKNGAVGELTYQVVTLKETGSETIKATGEKQVDKKATGTIVIYNNYNTSSQRLIKNTRFATPEGLIFRITDSVTVPGKKGTAPGSIEATVIADEVGEKYNAGLKDFTIPGFKGDPRYTTFYARSKTALAGGFSGVQKIVDETERAKAKARIEAKITTELTKQAFASINPGSAYFKNGYTIDFKALPEEVSGGDVTIKEEGTIVVVVFDKNVLGSMVAKKEINGYDNLPVFIKNLDALTFMPSKEFKPSGDSIFFNLSGPASFEWFYDELSLKQALLDKSRKDIPAILQKYPTIEKADISLRPFWSRSFPSSLEKIMVKKSA